MRVLAVNCGSSTLKFDALDAATVEVTRAAAGMIDRIGPEARAFLTSGDIRIERDTNAADHHTACSEALDLLDEAGLLEGIEAVGHRVVHGAALFREPVLIDDDVVAAIEQASELAPLHNGPALAAIRGARERLGAVPMVATFDTAFYAGLPDVATTYALPRELSERLGIRRYGFHGLAHGYMVERYRALRPDVERPRVISMQLGNGCSVTATVDRRPIDTSMGFTPLEGLIMGTRSGDVDPSVPLYLAEKEGMTPDEVDELLNKRSGLLGISGRTGDMRELVEAARSRDADADLAVRAFCYRALKYAGAYLAALGGADAVLFGGGIGENAPGVREAIGGGLEFAGLRLDAGRNARASGPETLITAEGSTIEAWVVAVDEASVIARDTVGVVG